jgi:hypothetical protein
MGLDYSYIIVLKQSNRKKLLDNLQRKTTLQKTDYGECATINFQLDKPISNYLKASIRREEGFNLRTTLLFKKSNFRDYFLDNETGIVGCIFYSEKEAEDNEHVFATFTAATTSMSILFKESLSIRKWFIELSREVNATGTFMDLEDEGYWFIYQNEHEIDLVINSLEIEPKTSDENFCFNICKAYERVTYITGD